MVFYRRNRVAGGTYFFTVTLRDQSSDLLVRHAVLLGDAFRSVRIERPFMIDAIIILSDHQIPFHARTSLCTSWPASKQLGFFAWDDLT